MAPNVRHRTIVLGDLHGSLEAFRSILTRAGLVDGDAWRGGRTTLVQLGDVVDRGPDSVATYQFLADLQRRAGQGRGRVVRLLGNHEVMLLEGIYEVADFPEPEKLAERIREDVLAERVVAAHSYNGWLFTHAGLHHALLQRLRTEMRTGSGSGGRFTLRRLAQHVNTKVRQAVETGRYSGPLFEVGEARGGDKELGGIFWADFDWEMASPARAPRIHQVFGHTPEGYEGARFRSSTDGRRINVDIGISEAYGGNLGYLEIVGREAFAHYIDEGGGEETVESMGTAPSASRGYKPIEPTERVG